MGFHKHGPYSFTVTVARMRVVGGHNFVADLSALRRHEASGTAVPMEVPAISEHYGETAVAAEGRAIAAICRWLDDQSGTERVVVPHAGPDADASAL